ncbi:hypothetical protein [Yoonia sp. I 8.24]|uniref:hypothetical protein n=1 Tax=Yoonia sp. I 8.24 TaxID=1537229 RepID=UPI001EE06828|nr:hypothetical protein [Yoonia sp. I 8.24]MCG3268030.1 hypothetical protein [Yoonia sp. I 8.24]
MSIIHTKQEDGKTLTIVATGLTEEIIVRSSVDYVPQFVTDVFGETKRVTKDITMAKLLRQLIKDYPDYELVSIGTPVNFDVAPTHLTRVKMAFESKDQVDKCLKEISVSDLLIRSRVQPAWSWESPMANALNVVLHVAWFDTVYFMQFKDIFLGDMHCRYSAKFGFDPNDAKITHFRYDEKGDLDEVSKLNQQEEYADSIKDQVEFLRVFRDGAIETA